MLRRAVILLLLLGATYALGSGTRRLINSRTHQLVGDLLTKVERTDSLIALTFDDGPTPLHTDSVLAVLAEYGAKATFFMVGQFMERNPEVVGRVLRAGHELGNHSYSHRRMVLQLPTTIRREIERTDSIIRSYGQLGPIFVRPPYGQRLWGLPWYLSRQGRPVTLWTLEPDTYHRQADDMVNHVLDRVSPGAIILLHVEIPARSEGRRALRDLIPQLKSRGYEFVTLSELTRLPSTS